MELPNDVTRYEHDITDHPLYADKRMHDKGYRYVIVFSRSALLYPLYAKTLEQACRTIRENYPHEKAYRIIDISELGDKPTEESTDAH